VATNDVSNLLQREADIALRMVQPTQGSTVAKRVGAVQLGAFAHNRYLVVPDLFKPARAHAG
jgi:hypothetical protein